MICGAPGQDGDTLVITVTMMTMIVKQDVQLMGSGVNGVHGLRVPHPPCAAGEASYLGCGDQDGDDDDHGDDADDDDDDDDDDDNEDFLIIHFGPPLKNREKKTLTGLL